MSCSIAIHAILVAGFVKILEALKNSNASDCNKHVYIIYFLKKVKAQQRPPRQRNIPVSYLKVVSPTRNLSVTWR